MIKTTVFFALCLIAASATARADNLLKNASYETVGSSADTAASWNRWGEWMNRETTWSPTHGGACLIGYHHWETTSDANSGIWQDVTTVKAGQKFKFSVFVWADPPENANATKTVEVRLEAIQNGHELMIASTSIPVSELLTAAKWHEISVTGTTPENNIRVLVVVSPGAAPRGGAVKIDDADLELVK